MRRSAITSGNGRNAFLSCVDSATATGSAAMPRLIAASSSGVFRLNLVLLIVVYLPVICFSKADNPHGVSRGVNATKYNRLPITQSPDTDLRRSHGGYRSQSTCSTSQDELHPPARRRAFAS